MPAAPLLRLRGFDYAARTAYLVTTCTWKRRDRFGFLRDGEMHLDRTGEIVREEWESTAAVRDDVRLDSYAILPDHFHAIVWLVDPPKDGGQRSSLSKILNECKAAVTRRWRRGPDANRFPLWQRGFHDRIVRSERELAAYREYVERNAEITWRRSLT